MENINVSDENAVLRRNLADAERRVEELEAQFDVEEMQDLKESILRLISAHMTEWAQRLQLEHAGAPYRLDDKQLTVVADTQERPIEVYLLKPSLNSLAPCRDPSGLAFLSQNQSSKACVNHFDIESRGLLWLSSLAKKLNLL